MNCQRSIDPMHEIQRKFGHACARGHFELDPARVRRLRRAPSPALRLAPDPGHAAGSTRAARGADETARDGARDLVLLVEDDALLRDIVADVLLDAGYDVHKAERGDQALEWLRADGRTPSVIVTDLMMPV